MSAISRSAALRVFLPFSFGYLLSYLYRTINAVIAPDLVADFALGADHLGLLSGAYFLTFAACQLPLGIALDRFGSRRTEAVLLVFAAAGGVVFATADDFTGLFLGRALIGLGVSACLMAAFKAFVVSFARERLPFVNGCQMAAGGLGAIAATTPVEAALAVTDWRAIFLFIAALTAACAAAIVLVVPDDSRHSPRVPLAELTAGLGRIYRSGLFWRVAPVTIVSQASFLGIQSLWTGPWLATVEQQSRERVADTLFFIALAMVCGFLIMGWAAARLARIGIAPMHVAFAGIGLFALAQAAIVAGLAPGALWPWLAFGFFGTTGIVPYAALSQQFPPALAGRLNTALNVLVFVAAFAVQWGIGGVIEAFAALFPALPASAGYRAAFALTIAAQIAGCVWFAAFRRRDVPGA
jgi:predicted MFS family arabinose efflux permease